MKISTLAENTACSRNFAYVHGLSLWIETEAGKILFDFGPDETFLKNAAVLGIDLSQADRAVLSHGHSDHGGSLGSFLNISGAPVYVCLQAFDLHGSRKPDGISSLSLDGRLKNHPQIRFCSSRMEIGKNLVLFSDIRTSFFPVRANDSLLRQENGQWIPDDFHHEQNLLITENGKTVLLCGCAHRGILNILLQAREILGKDPDVCLGGFHLYKPSTGQCEDPLTIRRLAGELKHFQTGFYTCHCTGEQALKILQEQLGDQIQTVSSGSVLKL